MRRPELEADAARFRELAGEVFGRGWQTKMAAQPEFDHSLRQVSNWARAIHPIPKLVWYWLWAKKSQMSEKEQP